MLSISSHLFSIFLKSIQKVNDRSNAPFRCCEIERHTKTFQFDTLLFGFVKLTPLTALFSQSLQCGFQIIRHHLILIRHVYLRAKPLQILLAFESSFQTFEKRRFSFPHTFASPRPLQAFQVSRKASCLEPTKGHTKIRLPSKMISTCVILP